MQKRTKGCLWIALGVTCFVVMVGVVVIGGLGYTLYQQFNVNAHFLPREDAARQLDEVRARFAGQEPRLNVRRTEDGTPDLKITPPASPNTVPLTTLHVAAFDASNHKLVNFSVPFWLLRLAPDGKMRVNGEEVLNHLSTPSGRLTVRDIEALGPGLLVDDSRPDGSRAIVWTE